jgi:signal transduction histidine kinase/CheY-like chemotaxis protein
VVDQKTSALSAGEARYRELYEELKVREERLNFSLESAGCGLWDWAIETGQMYFDPNYYRMIGYEPASFPATFDEWKKRVHTDDIEAAEVALHDCMAGRTENYTSEYRLLTATGQWLWVMDKGDVIERKEDGSPLRFIGLHVDISGRVAAEQQRQELEAQLRQKYKVEAIGLMAGGMAHNFNNNLAIILGSVELAQRRIEQGHKAVPLLENIKTAALRSRDLVQQVLVYSRKGVINKEQINPAEVVKQTVKLLQLTIPATVQIQCRIESGADAHHVRGDATQIQEALINLCNNAVYAMEEKGTLKISVNHAQLSASQLPPQVKLPDSGFVQIAVMDSGSGVAAEIQDKVFDPFFTTKEVHAGTGMGLATVQGVMDQHGGFVKLDSAPGRGAEFSLFFPAAKGDNSRAAAVDAEPIEGDERILFVDDDVMVAEVGRQMLEQAGYRVTLATRGDLALKMVINDPYRFDLVITDQTMPELSGEELMARLLSIRSDLPVILCTGYSNRIDAEGARALGARAFLLKPLKMLELLVRVRQVLDGRSN